MHGVRFVVIHFTFLVSRTLPAQYANLSGLTRSNRKREFTHLLILEWKKKKTLIELIYFQGVFFLFPDYNLYYFIRLLDM